MMKMSEITIVECKNFLRIDFSEDDFFIEMALDCAKSYVCNYCKRTADDLDNIPVTTKNWTELSNVKTYYNFFKERSI